MKTRQLVRRMLLFRLACGMLALCLTSCTALHQTQRAADTIYLNGRVYTVDDANPWAQAVAIAEGALIAVGSDAEVSAFRAPATNVIDLQGRFAMPGIHDMHLHPLDGGLKGRFECSFPSTLTLPQILEVVRSCVAKMPEGQWVRGGQWALSLLKSPTPPTRDMLDQISTEHPIFLMDWSVHNAWLNSKGLEVLGIDDATPDPAGGRIMRNRETGRATGILLDNAAYEAQGKLPPYTAAQNAQAIRWGIDQFLGFGITSIKDAHVSTGNLHAYRDLADAGDLPIRVSSSLAWKSAWSESRESELHLMQNRQSFARPFLDTSFAKIMLDGVPLAYTSALLDPYLPSEAHGDQFRGKLIFQPQELKVDLIALDRQGLTVKIHATGDRSARVALDAIEAAREANGDSGLMHEISHAQMIHPQDIPRFKALGVAAEMCPILWYPGPSSPVRASVLGARRADQFWPVKDLLAAGALVFYGSDWPAVVPNANPWPGLEAMVTRRNPYGTYPGAQWPEQAVDLKTAIRIFTLNGAVAGKSADRTGSLEVGKAADFIILDRNPFEIPIEEVSELRVLRTVVNGVVAFSQEEPSR